jgi:hypothetical protein
MTRSKIVETKIVATALKIDDCIVLGGGLVWVVGADPVTEDHLLPLVTEDADGHQYIDYINPERLIPVVTFTS